MAKYIPTITNVKTVSDMRTNPVELLQYVSKHRAPLYIFHRSKPMAALIDLESFSEVLELQQAREDLQVAIKTSDKSFVSFDELDKELKKKHGLQGSNRKKS